MKFFQNLEFQIRVLLQRAYRPKNQIIKNYSFLGNKVDGGWPVINEMLDNNSVIYSFGVGDNISWDKEMINSFDVNIHSFDPNPDSIKWLNSQNIPEQLSHYPYALGWENVNMQFYINHDNIAGGSMIKSKEHLTSIDVPCYTLETIMNKLNHSFIDVLKIDIEGAEYKVIEDILNCEIAIKQLLVEFHHRSKGNYSVKDTKDAIKLLNSAGYKVFWSSDRGREIAFLKE